MQVIHTTSNARSGKLIMMMLKGAAFALTSANGQMTFPWIRMFNCRPSEKSEFVYACLSVM